MKKLLLSIVLSACIGCSQFDEPEHTQLFAVNQNPDAETMLLTRSGGESTENPYSLANVQAAYDSLVVTDGLEPLDIDPSHYYVRFLPQDTLQFGYISDSLHLELFDYPMDRELSDEEIDFYSNDLVNGWQWLYTIVPTDFEFPQGIQTEVLDDIYIQDTDEEVSPMSSGREGGNQTSPVTLSWSPPIFDNEIYDRIIDKSFEITGNTEEPEGGIAPIGLLAAQWSPSATVTFMDPVTNAPIKIEGLKIRVSNFVNVASDFTDSNGYVGGLKGWGGKFRYGVRYKIIYENDGRPYYWNIRNGRTLQAKLKGPDKKAHHDFYIDGTATDSESRQQSTFILVHRVTWDFYMKQTALTRCVNIAPMNIGVKWDDYYNGLGDPEAGHFASWIRWFSNTLNWGNPIIIWGKHTTSPHNYYSLMWVIGTIAHELGHSSHWQNVINTHGVNRLSHFQNAESKLVESYANAVRYYILTRLYPNNSADYARSYGDEYTGIGEALLTHGFSMSELQNTATQSSTWAEWKTNVKNLNKLDNNLLEMFFRECTDTWNVDLRQCIAGPDVFYTTSTALYEIPDEGVIDNNISVQWMISGTAGTDYVVTGGLTNRQLNVRFLTLGNRTVTAILTLPNSGGQTYSVVKNVRVVTNATLTGLTSPRIGTRNSYTLRNASSNITWRVFKKENGTLTRVDANSYDHHYPYSSSSTSLGVMFLQSGTYVIKAQDTSTSRIFDVAELEVTVPYEPSKLVYVPLYDIWNGKVLNNQKLYRKHHGPHYGSMIFPGNPGGIIGIGDPGVPLVGIPDEGTLLPTDYHFYAWERNLPSSSNPLYSTATPVYWKQKLPYQYPGIPNFTLSYSNYWTPAQGGSSTVDAIVYYISSTQRTGMVPIYRIREELYIDRVEKWGNYFLSPVNIANMKIVTKRRLGKDRDWSAMTNLGIAGYAYPALN